MYLIPVVVAFAAVGVGVFAVVPVCCLQNTRLLYIIFMLLFVLLSLGLSENDRALLLNPLLRAESPTSRSYPQVTKQLQLHNQLRNLHEIQINMSL